MSPHHRGAAGHSGSQVIESPRKRHQAANQTRTAVSLEEGKACQESLQ